MSKPDPHQSAVSATRMWQAVSRRRSPWLAYGVAVAGTAGTLGLRLALQEKAGDTPALTLFIIPIALSAYLGGLGPGLVATTLAALGAAYYLLPPLHSLAIHSTLQLLQFLVLILAGAFITVLMETRKRLEGRLRGQAVDLAAARQSLGATEQQVTGIINSAMDAIIAVDEQQRVILFNPAAERMFGSSAAQALGQSLERFIPERFRAAHAAHIHNFGQTKVSRRNMGQLGTIFGLRSDGTEFPIEASISQSETAGEKVFTVVLRDVTERLRAEGAVQQQARLLELSFDAILVWEFDGTISYWNQGATDLYGFTAEQALGRVSHELMQTRHPQGLEAFRNALKGDGVWAGVLQHRTRDGRLIEVDSRHRLVRQANGREIVFESNRDVSERRDMVQALEEEQARLAGIIGSATDSIIAVDEQQRIILFNPAAEKMFGSSAAQALGQSLERFIPERFRAAHAGHIHNFGQTKVSRRNMGQLGTIFGLRSDGTEFPIEASISQVETRGAKVFTVILRDITERMHAEEARSNLAAIVESSDDAIMGKTLEGVITSWNRGAQRLYGFTPQEAVGRPISIITPPEREGELEQILETVRRGGLVEHLETVRRRRDGTKVDVSVTISPIRNAEGVIVGASAIARDITASKKAEEAQLRSQKLESLGTLAGGIAHDFNNILLAMTGNTRLVSAELPPAHPAQESLAEVLKAGARATDLVRRILSFSRPAEQEREVIQLQPVVLEALKLVRSTLPAMIEIRADFAPGLPPVAVNSTQVHQVIVNLATNASHAIGEKPGLIEVRLEGTGVGQELLSALPGLKAGDYVRLSVTDNGCGMDRATQERIFDPFFTTKPQGKGTGLGLSVVHGIMKSHGGGVTVYSEPGKGTSFRLYFPSAAGQAESRPAEEPQAERRRGEHVLYIDDESALVRLAKRGLERLGYRVTGFTDPLAALAEFRRRPREFDAVVTDLSMPGMSGFGLAEELLVVRPDVPIIATSGYVRPEDQDMARRLGVRNLIPKPDSLDELSRALDAVFRGCVEV